MRNLVRRCERGLDVSRSALGGPILLAVQRKQPFLSLLTGTLKARCDTTQSRIDTTMTAL